MVETKYDDLIGKISVTFDVDQNIQTQDLYKISEKYKIDTTDIIPIGLLFDYSEVGCELNLLYRKINDNSKKNAEKKILLCKGGPEILFNLFVEIKIKLYRSEFNFNN